MATVTRSRNLRRNYSATLKKQYTKVGWALIATAPVVAAIWAGPAYAQTATWDSSGTNPTAPTDGGGLWDSQTSANWSVSGADVVWPGSADVAQFGTNNGAAGTVTIDDSSGGVTAAGINFNAPGSGNYVIAANSSDTLSLTGTSAVPAAITVATGLSPTISAPIAGANGFTLIGPGTLNLSGVNTYTGNTVLNGGTLDVNSGATLGSGAGLVMGLIGAQAGGTVTPSTSVNTLNLSANETVGSYTINTNSSTANALSIGAGNTLTVSGAFSLGLAPPTAAVSGTFATSLTVTGSSGTLVVDPSGSANFDVERGAGSSTPASSQSATLNLSGLNSFTYGNTGNTGEFTVGVENHALGIAKLAVNSTIISNDVRIGDSFVTLFTTALNGNGTSTLSLGTGNTLIDSNTIVVGAAKGNGVINFQASTGSLTINNEAGTGGAVLDVGEGVSGSSNCNGTMNVDGHMLTLTLSTLNVGNRVSDGTNAGEACTGIFSFDEGTVNTTALTLAHCQGSGSIAGSAIATVNVGSTTTSTPATLNVNIGNTAATQQFGNASASNSANDTATSILNILSFGAVNINGSIDVISIAGNTATATVNVEGGTFNLVASTHNIDNGITLVTTGGEIENIGTIDTTGGVTMNTAGNTLIIDGTNAWTGGTTVSAGTVQVGQASDAAALTQPLGAAAGTVTVGTTLNFASSQATTVANPIAGTGVLNLNGAGIVTLSASNTYQGNTTVNAGGLTVTNTSGSATGSGNVTMNAGILASGTTGAIAGNVLAGTGAHTIAPGGVGSIGTLTIGGLTSSTLTTLNFDLGTGSGLITNCDNLILSGLGTVSIGAGTAMTFGGTPVAGNDYQLIGDLTSGSTVGAIPLSNFTLPTAPAGFSYSLALSGGFIDLDVTSTGPTTLTWTNASGSGTWSTASANWNNGNNNVTYTEGANVAFNDNNPGPNGTPANYAVTLNANVNPGSIAVNNSDGNYTISGSGSITGGGSLTKNGTGVFAIDTTGTILGAVTVNNGSVQLGTSTGLATVTSLSVGANGTFDVNNNHVIINYGSPANDPIASIAALLKTGYNHGGWNGVGGIISTAAQVNNATPGNLLYGLGYADSADSGNPAGLSSGTVEIKYTLLGDANLSGVVDGTDFGIVAANFNKGVTGWDQGDFNYDNVVDGTDFGDLAANFNKGASGASVGLPAIDDPAIVAFAEANGLMSELTASVPEPASIGLMAIGACGLLARRRKSTC